MCTFNESIESAMTPKENEIDKCKWERGSAAFLIHGKQNKTDHAKYETKQ